MENRLAPLSKQPRVLVLVGPTGSGKTPVSLHLATILDGEIISADSRQIYRFMDIGTAKPDRGEMRRVKHYFIDEVDPDEEFNAGEYGRKGRAVIADVVGRGKTPIVVGGSGLYVRSLIDGLFEGPGADDEVRRNLHRRLHADGKESLYEELCRVDPASARKMGPSNSRRVIRALEVYHLTGVPISQHHLMQGKRQKLSADFYGLEWDRRKLYERIDLRVDWMLDRGLVEEVKSLKERGYDESLKSFQTVGYREVFEFLARRITREEMVDLIKQNSRRYAKRQLTWFRKERRIEWVRLHDDREFPDAARAIAEKFAAN